MYLNDLWISDEAIEQNTFSDGVMALRVDLPWEDLPILLQLTPELVLRWDHISQDDPNTGVPTQLARWRATRRSSPRLIVSVWLKCRRGYGGSFGATQSRSAPPQK